MANAARFSIRIKKSSKDKIIVCPGRIVWIVPTLEQVVLKYVPISRRVHVAVVPAVLVRTKVGRRKEQNAWIVPNAPVAQILEADNAIQFANQNKTGLYNITKRCVDNAC